MSDTDIQAALTKNIIKRIQNDSGVAIQLLPEAEFLSAEKRIRGEASHAIEALAETAEYEINLPYLAMVDGEPLNFTCIIKRSTLEEVSRKLGR
jgi:hypothetical protein